MAQGDVYMSLRDRKLVVLGIPWDVETDELKYYMMKFGELEDVIVMKDRATGRSRGFGYVTFSSAEDARKATAAHHVLNGRMLEVKVATPREEMRPSASRKINRIFVARISPSVTDEMFRSYFQKYGVIIDAYMPKDVGSRAHRGIGFVTFESPDSVDKLMNETHELGGSTIAVDRATPKEETLKFWGKAFPDGYSFYNAYMNAAAQYGAFGVGAMGGAMGGYDYTGFGLSGDMGMVNTGSSGGGDNVWDPSNGGMFNSSSFTYGSSAPPSGSLAAATSAAGSAGADNAWDPSNGGVANCSSFTYGSSAPPSGAPAAATSAAGYASSVPPTGGPAAATSASGYASSAPPTGTAAAATPAGYASSAPQSVPPAAATSAGYASSAPPSGAPAAVTSAAGYGTSAHPTPATGMGNKVFIGRLPMEASAEHLRTYFSSFGRILDVYVPKDAKKKGHRGFGFVTFFEDGVAERVALQSHEILGQPIAVDRPTPQDGGASMPYMNNFSAPPSSAAGATPPTWGNAQGMGYGSFPASFDYYSGGWGSYGGGAVGPVGSGDVASGNRASRTDVRYKPY